MRESSRISPTAFYTGQVWLHHKMSPSALGSWWGTAAYATVRPFDLAAGALIGVSLERVLLERHRIIDHFLTEAVEKEGVTQVLEIAAGLSPRGLRFARRYPELTYLEGDLPGMSARKAKLVATRGLGLPNLHFAPVDAFARGGSLSLEACVDARFDPTRPLVVITEGLIPYFDHAAVVSLWERVAALLGPRGGGTYLSDIYTGQHAGRYTATRALLMFLRVVAGAEVHLHFDDLPHARDTMERYLGTADIHDARSLPELFPGLKRGSVAVHVGRARVPSHVPDDEATGGG